MMSTTCEVSSRLHGPKGWWQIFAFARCEDPDSSQYGLERELGPPRCHNATFFEAAITLYQR